MCKVRPTTVSLVFPLIFILLSATCPVDAVSSSQNTNNMKLPKHFNRDISSFPRVLRQTTDESADEYNESTENQKDQHFKDLPHLTRNLEELRQLNSNSTSNSIATCKELYESKFTWSKLRIGYEITGLQDVSKYAAEAQNFVSNFEEKVVKPAVAFWQKALSVRRFETSPMKFYPDNLRDYCTVGNTQKHVDFPITASGTEKTEIDAFIYFQVVESDNMACVKDGTEISWSNICGLDQCDMPVYAHITFCQHTVDDGWFDLNTDLKTDKFVARAVHELGNVLGFNADLYPYWKDAETGEDLVDKKTSSKQHNFSCGSITDAGAFEAKNEWDLKNGIDGKVGGTFYDDLVCDDEPFFYEIDGPLIPDSLKATSVTAASSSTATTTKKPKHASEPVYCKRGILGRVAGKMGNFDGDDSSQCVYPSRYTSKVMKGEITTDHFASIVGASGSYDYNADMFVPSCQLEIRTKNVVKHAREYFKCPTLSGMPLENTPSQACKMYGGRWEQRIIDGDVMTTYAIRQSGNVQTSFVSAITLALFEDTGWYQPDYTRATKAVKYLQPGYHKGCEWLSKPCVGIDMVGGQMSAAGRQPSFPEVYCMDSLQESCGPNLDEVTKCSISSSRASGYPKIPELFQYFGDDGKGGNDPTKDYCPVLDKVVTGRNCKSTSAGAFNVRYSTNFAGTASDAEKNLQFEIGQKEDSFCFLSNLRIEDTLALQTSKKMTISVPDNIYTVLQPNCYRAECDSNGNNAYTIYAFEPATGTELPVTRCVVEINADGSFGRTKDLPKSATDAATIKNLLKHDGQVMCQPFEAICRQDKSAHLGSGSHGSDLTEKWRYTDIKTSSGVPSNAAVFKSYETYSDPKFKSRTVLSQYRGWKIVKTSVLLVFKVTKSFRSYMTDQEFSDEDSKRFQDLVQESMSHLLNVEWDYGVLTEDVVVSKPVIGKLIDDNGKYISGKLETENKGPVKFSEDFLSRMPGAARRVLSYFGIVKSCEEMELEKRFRENAVKDLLANAMIITDGKNEEEDSSTKRSLQTTDEIPVTHRLSVVIQVKRVSDHVADVVSKRLNDEDYMQNNFKGALQQKVWENSFNSAKKIEELEDYFSPDLLNILFGVPWWGWVILAGTIMFVILFLGWYYKFEIINYLREKGILAIPKHKTVRTKGKSADGKYGKNKKKKKRNKSEGDEADGDEDLTKSGKLKKKKKKKDKDGDDSGDDGDETSSKKLKKKKTKKLKKEEGAEGDNFDNVGAPVENKANVVGKSQEPMPVSSQVSMSMASE